MIQQDRLQLRWLYNENLHERANIANLAQEFVDSLKGIVDSGGRGDRDPSQTEDVSSGELKHDELSV
jgi:hypothetical protein